MFIYLFIYLSICIRDMRIRHVRSYCREAYFHSHCSIKTHSYIPFRSNILIPISSYSNFPVLIIYTFEVSNYCML